MSDDLKNSLKDLEAYVQQENKEKKKEQIKFERDLKKMSYESQFPLNKVLFCTFAVVGGFIYAGEKLTPILVQYAPKPVAEQYEVVVKQKEAYVETLFKKTEEIKNTKAPIANPGKGVEGSNAQVTPAANAERGVANQAVNPNDPQWVQIDRKWYRKTPDNIYIVNGKRMLYIENRPRQIAPEKPSNQ